MADRIDPRDTGWRGGPTPAMPNGHGRVPTRNGDTYTTEHIGDGTSTHELPPPEGVGQTLDFSGDAFSLYLQLLSFVRWFLGSAYSQSLTQEQTASLKALEQALDAATKTRDSDRKQLDSEIVKNVALAMSGVAKAFGATGFKKPGGFDTHTWTTGWTGGGEIMQGFLSSFSAIPGQQSVTGKADAQTASAEGEFWGRVFSFAQGSQQQSQGGIDSAQNAGNQGIGNAFAIV